ncbi:MAG: hypothetical protein U5J78_07670 [Parasphingorhabdus sp.]|nr:hypothetical protein [Parasphingorhabdus sp.]
MTIKTLILTALLIALASCQQTARVSEEQREAQSGATRENSDPESVTPPLKPVRIGEGGPRFDACQSIGQTNAPDGGMLDVRPSPFDDAKSVGQIPSGRLVYICTRSIDQQWLGIVYDDTPAPVAAADIASPPKRGPGDCGVSSPVRSKQNYSGPCKSGWVESTYVVLVAG